jgi:hypothetical protein
MIDAVGLVILIMAIFAPDVLLFPVFLFWSVVGSILDFVLNLVLGPKDKEGGKD